MPIVLLSTTRDAAILTICKLVSMSRIWKRAGKHCCCSHFYMPHNFHIVVRSFVNMTMACWHTWNCKRVKRVAGSNIPIAQPSPLQLCKLAEWHHSTLHPCTWRFRSNSQVRVGGLQTTAADYPAGFVLVTLLTLLRLFHQNVDLLQQTSYAQAPGACLCSSPLRWYIITLPSTNLACILQCYSHGVRLVVKPILKDLLLLPHYCYFRARKI